jgi:Skp family chaperone for outer membrane proteins
MTRNSYPAALFLIVTAASSTWAQRPAAPTQQPAVQQISGPIPDSKIALIYSSDFRDAKTGITRYQTILAALQREFQSTNSELSQLAQRVQQLQDDINRTSQAPAVDPKSVQAKSDQLELLKRDYQRKYEDAQAAYKKRHDEVMAPLNDDINKALVAYAKAHSISVIIDGTQVPMIYVDDKVDITRAFISEFNSKNPSATAPAPVPTRP